jgi:DNA-binding transcriptional MerR regulator
MRSSIRSSRGLSIRQLIERAGVTAPTVHHYVSLGLLPEPERPHRRMAYYDPACVERIAHIKALQSKRFLPLGVIKKLLDQGGAEGLRRADIGILQGMGDAETREPREEVLRRYPLGTSVLATLIRQGLVSGGNKPFSADEVEIVAAIYAMRQAGLDERLGFSAEGLGMYRRMLDSLIDTEFAGFNERVLGQVSSEDEVRLATAAIVGSSKILTMLHRRLVRERLDELSRANARPAPSRAQQRRPLRRRPGL